MMKKTVLKDTALPWTYTDEGETADGSHVYFIRALTERTEHGFARDYWGRIAMTESEEVARYIVENANGGMTPDEVRAAQERAADEVIDKILRERHEN